MAPELTRANAPPGGPQSLHLIGQKLQPRRLQRAVRPRQHVGADLDDHGVRLGQHFLPQQIRHTPRLRFSTDPARRLQDICTLVGGRGSCRA